MTKEFNVATSMFSLVSITDDVNMLFYFLDDAFEYMKQNNIVGQIHEIPVLRTVNIG